MKNTLLILFSVLLLGACRKVPDFDQLSSDFIVSTSLDQSANFGNYKTFYIADTVEYIGGVGADSIIVGDKALQLVNAVKTNLTSRGYTFTGRNNKPDLGLTLTAIKDINVIISGYPGWWDGYWGGCYWYYWCYPYYYPWTSVYTYTTGTVILNMYDLKNAATNQQIKGLWNTTGLGALGTGGTSNVQLGIDAINQGFTQSPYIKTP
jgi:hypothetical protein